MPRLGPVNINREMLINSADEMMRNAQGTKQPRLINATGEGASIAQRSDSLVQRIDQRFHSSVKWIRSPTRFILKGTK